jgi:hypothetical protein
MLLEGLEAARAGSRRSELAAGSAVSVFVRKLGAVLLNAGRFEEAAQFLQSSIEENDTRPAERAVALEQLAIALAACGRDEEASRRQEEARALAEQCGDEKLRERLLEERRQSRIRQRVDSRFRTPYAKTAPSLHALAATVPEARATGTENASPSVEQTRSDKRIPAPDLRRDEEDAAAPMVDVIDMGSPRRKR